MNELALAVSKVIFWDICTFSASQLPTTIKWSSFGCDNSDKYPQFTQLVPHLFRWISSRQGDLVATWIEEIVYRFWKYADSLSFPVRSWMNVNISVFERWGELFWRKVAGLCVSFPGWFVFVSLGMRCKIKQCDLAREGRQARIKVKLTQLGPQGTTSHIKLLDSGSTRGEGLWCLVYKCGQSGWTAFGYCHISNGSAGPEQQTM